MIRTLPILKYVPEKIGNFKLVGSGFFGVCIDEGEKEPVPLVTIISSQYTKQELEKINSIKQQLKIDGVQLAVDYDIQPIYFDNPVINTEIENSKYGYFKMAKEGVIYKEEYMTGIPFYINTKKTVHHERAHNIPPIHLQKYILDAYHILDAGLTLDYIGLNFLYDKKKGFSFIDISMVDPADFAEIPGLSNCPEYSTIEKLLDVVTAVFSLSSSYAHYLLQLLSVDINNQTYLKDTFEFLHFWKKVHPVFSLLEQSYPSIVDNAKYQKWKNIYRYADQLQQMVSSLPLYRQWLNCPHPQEYVYIPDEEEELEKEDGMDDM